MCCFSSLIYYFKSFLFSMGQPFFCRTIIIIIIIIIIINIAIIIIIIIVISIIIIKQENLSCGCLLATGNLLMFSIEFLFSYALKYKTHCSHIIPWALEQVFNGLVLHSYRILSLFRWNLVLIICEIFCK